MLRNEFVRDAGGGKGNKYLALSVHVNSTHFGFPCLHTTLVSACNPSSTPCAFPVRDRAAQRGAARVSQHGAAALVAARAFARGEQRSEEPTQWGGGLALSLLLLLFPLVCERHAISHYRIASNRNPFSPAANRVIMCVDATLHPSPRKALRMRTVILDIESTSLRADTGFLLCVGLKEVGRPPRILGLRDFPAQDRDDVLTIDSALVKAVKHEIETYDYVLGWNSILFDVPFLNDRLLFSGQLPIQRMFHTDLMYLARLGKSTMTSSRLDWVARKLNLPVTKTALDINTWKRAEAEAMLGFTRADNYRKIVEHNRRDLLVTERVYQAMKPRIMTIQKR